MDTAAAYRRQQVCSTLLRTAILDSFARPGIQQRVIVSDQGSIAEKIYRSLGFQVAGYQYGSLPHDKDRS